MVQRQSILLISLFVKAFVQPAHQLVLKSKAARRRNREMGSVLTTGTIENVTVIIPDRTLADSRSLSYAPYKWTIEVTFSYSHAGEYYSNVEKRTFFSRATADRFLALLGNYSASDGVVLGAANSRLDELSLSRPKVTVSVGLAQEHPDQGTIVGFFEAPETFACRVQRVVPQAAR